MNFFIEELYKLFIGLIIKIIICLLIFGISKLFDIDLAVLLLILFVDDVAERRMCNKSEEEEED